MDDVRKVLGNEEWYVQALYLKMVLAVVAHALPVDRFGSQPMSASGAPDTQDGLPLHRKAAIQSRSSVRIEQRDGQIPSISCGSMETQARVLVGQRGRQADFGAHQLAVHRVVGESCSPSLSHREPTILSEVDARRPGELPGALALPAYGKDQGAVRPPRANLGLPRVQDEDAVAVGISPHGCPVEEHALLGCACESVLQFGEPFGAIVHVGRVSATAETYEERHDGPHRQWALPGGPHHRHSRSSEVLQLSLTKRRRANPLTTPPPSPAP